MPTPQRHATVAGSASRTARPNHAINPRAYGDQLGALLAFLSTGFGDVFDDAPDFGRAAVDQFAAVPERSTWAGTILGVTGIVAGLRNRRGGGTSRRP